MKKDKFSSISSQENFEKVTSSQATDSNMLIEAISALSSSNPSSFSANQHLKNLRRDLRMTTISKLRTNQAEVRMIQSDVSRLSQKADDKLIPGIIVAEEFPHIDAILGGPDIFPGCSFAINGNGFGDVMGEVRLEYETYDGQAVSIMLSFLQPIIDPVTHNPFPDESVQWSQHSIFPIIPENLTGFLRQSARVTITRPDGAEASHNISLHPYMDIVHLSSYNARTLQIKCDHSYWSNSDDCQSNESVTFSSLHIVEDGEGTDTFQMLLKNQWEIYAVSDTFVHWDTILSDEPNITGWPVVRSNEIRFSAHWHAGRTIPVPFFDDIPLIGPLISHISPVRFSGMVEFGFDIHIVGALGVPYE